jgi:hypothetical protein
MAKSISEALEELRQAYHKATGYTLTIGVGDTPSKAAQAMVYGKLNGKDCVKRWNKEVEEKVGGHKETAEEKYKKEGLIKAEGGSVVVAVRNPILDNLYLHGRRMDDHKWALPAGAVLPGESREEAARRILREDFDVEPTELRQVGSADGGKTYLFVGVGRIADTTVNLMDGSPYLDVKYIDPMGKNSYHVPRQNNVLMDYLKQRNAPGHDLSFTNHAGFDRRKGILTSPDGEVTKSEAAPRQYGKPQASHPHQYDWHDDEAVGLQKDQLPAQAQPHPTNPQAAGTGIKTFWRHRVKVWNR